ncbi:hypothetical protein [Aurantibacillus circumpalustris]|uniref:hypothetical protein n=1 Tax=Aurantibacillus circumpalustris TaxID=3036359 RepID=UPI00295A7666|nr:hypothetical protein [Aurantibacillus circumpalustris]
MKKGIIVIAILALAMSTVKGQKKYEKIVYVETAGECKEASITAKSVFSTAQFAKFNLKIRNNSDEILLYKADESKLKANGKDYIPKEKPLVIPPTETDNRVIDVKGTEFMVTDYTFEVNGIYKVSTTSNSVAATDFQLPPSQNEFKVGGFTCNMTDLKKETDKTAVKFECRYTGDKIGVIHPGRAAIKLPDGTEIANAKSTASPVLVAKGESEKISLRWDRMQGGKTTDMQLINLLIVWRNTFVEAEPVKLDPIVLEFKIDEAKSK